MDKKKLIIFDLDGTLIDSLKDIALCTNSVLKELGCEEHPIEVYKEFTGDGARELVKRALPNGFSEEKIQKALGMFKEIYSNKINENTKPFDGIYEMLKALEDSCDLALLSNKPHKFTLEYMELFFSEFNFQSIHGQKEEVAKKPDPAGVYNILDELDYLDYKKDDVYFIGDTATDMKTAINSGVIPIGVLWGTQEEDKLIQNGAQYTVQTPQEIVQIILKK
jgi:phosphoglycolate phosphatase